VIRYLQETNWDGAVSIECSGTDENTRQSLAFMRSVVAGG
jgi:sugar phosphate isomerase/epimerase